MAKLTEKERMGFEGIMEADMLAIDQKLISQIRDFWSKAREEVLKTKGWDKLIIEKDKLECQIKKSKDRIHEIENKMREEELKPEQITELGGRPDKWGRYMGANFHAIPVECQFDYDIVEYIRKHVDLNVPAKFIHDLGRAALRALTMSGTFEEARKAYEEFYALDFRKYGVDIPPRLEEVKENIEELGYTQCALAAPVDKHGDFKALKNKKEEKKQLDYMG